MLIATKLLFIFALLIVATFAEPKDKEKDGDKGKGKSKKPEKFVKAKALDQEVKNGNWPKATGKSLDYMLEADHRDFLNKWQRVSDVVSGKLGAKTKNHFAAVGLCTKELVCETITNASTAKLDKGVKAVNKPEAITDKDMKGFLEHLWQHKTVRLTHELQKGLLYAGEVHFGNVIARLTDFRKREMSAEHAAGLLFDAWKLIALEEKPTAVRAVLAQTDGKPVVLRAVCLFSKDSHHGQADHFCRGQDKDPNSKDEEEGGDDKKEKDGDKDSKKDKKKDEEKDGDKKEKKDKKKDKKKDVEKDGDKKEKKEKKKDEKKDEEKDHDTEQEDKHDESEPKVTKKKDKKEKESKKADGKTDASTTKVPEHDKDAKKDQEHSKDSDSAPTADHHDEHEEHDEPDEWTGADDDEEDDEDDDADASPVRRRVPASFAYEQAGVFEPREGYDFSQFGAMGQRPAAPRNPSSQNRQSPTAADIAAKRAKIQQARDAIAARNVPNKPPQYNAYGSTIYGGATGGASTPEYASAEAAAGGYTGGSSGSGFDSFDPAAGAGATIDTGADPSMEGGEAMLRKRAIAARKAHLKRMAAANVKRSASGMSQFILVVFSSLT